MNDGMDIENLQYASSTKVRQAIRAGRVVRPTSGLANGYVQANLVILDKSLAFDFLLFCQRNPKPCPVLDVTEAGDPTPHLVAPNADVRYDLPKYRVYKNGQLVEEPENLSQYWNSSAVAFILGCSFTFEQALTRNCIPVRHVEEDHNVPMYRTNIQCVKAGPFAGPMVVSMRPIPYADVVRCVQVTSRFPSVHGAPIHIGDPAQIGIDRLENPDFGEPVTVRDGEVPVFWACGVTPQAVAMHVKPDLMITHAPGHMFITDMHDEQLSVL